MKKVAVFGNAGGGKSTLSKKLAQMTGLPLFPLDLMKYQAGGEMISDEEYQAQHDQLMQQEKWILDGFGSLKTVWQRLEAADTLIYLDMPVYLHYWWVTKRFLKGFFVSPESWPENSPLLKGTLNSYYTVWLCEKKLTHKYRDYINQVKNHKSVYHLRSPQDIKQFYQILENSEP